MKLIFFGTPQFAVPTLEKLVEAKFEIELVVTNPDEPVGRSQALHAPPVKDTAEKFRLNIFQPRKLKDPGVRERLSEFHPDAGVIVAYGHILPQWLIDIPHLGCINLHASLLPKYRGAAPIPWAIIHGEQITGVTTMKIDAGMDTGDVLLQREAEIAPDDTRESLEKRLSVIGANLMVETLRGLEQGTIEPKPQDSNRATLAPMLKKEDGKMDWSLTAEEIARRVRGLEPWPGSYSTFRGKTVNVRAAVPAAIQPRAPHEIGELIAEGNRLIVACGKGTSLEVLEIQLEGRKRMSAREFLNGARLRFSETFGA
jgi:methionyl-tRNA formyltransferase